MNGDEPAGRQFSGQATDQRDAATSNAAPAPDDHVAATRRAYGESAHRYASMVGTTVSPAFEAPLDLAVLDTFAELAGRSGGVAVDAGCGTGRVARFLADSGLSVLGVDIAEKMIIEARRAHPDLDFDLAELTALPCAASSIGAVAYWYSIITTPPEAIDAVWSELRRALVPEGIALVAFQSGVGERVHTPNAFGTRTDLTLFRHDPIRVRAGLESIGLTVHTLAQRRPLLDHESTDQTFIIATAPG